MTLTEKFVPVQEAFYSLVNFFFRLLATFFGYPKVPGMPINNFISTNKGYQGESFINLLPRHNTFFPPAQRPTTWFEAIFGDEPRPDIIPKHFYQNNVEGFFNFYVENYQNLYVLPNWLSKTVQVYLHMDNGDLENIRTIAFQIIIALGQLLMLRIFVSWFLIINPYTIPWCYLCSSIDWLDELFLGAIPSLFGVNSTTTFVILLIGSIGDSLNHLVFTIPYLPSEGMPSKMLIDGETKDVLIFHYLPNLWESYPIPNYLRNFWYYERPDVLNYLQENYPGIQFLPTTGTSGYLSDFFQLLGLNIIF